MEFERVLALSAHTDDAEIGAGGAIHYLASRGSEVDHLVFSKCRKSVPEGYTLEEMLDECREADRTLGIKETEILDFPVREFSEHRQDILELLWKKRQENYDLLLCPWPRDTHQDHQQLATEAVRAWKRALPTILFYSIPANCLGFAPNFFFILSEENAKVKIDALAQYRSQITRVPEYFCLEKFRSVLLHTGMLVGCTFAEGFEMHSTTLR